MRDELIRQYAAVLGDVDGVYCDGGYLGEDDAAQGICEREVDVCEVEIYVIVVCLIAQSH